LGLSALARKHDGFMLPGVAVRQALLIKFFA
jgi:hypothetical protein